MDGVDHRDTYVSRRSALKNPVTSEAADVPPFLLVQINFYCAGAWPRGASTSGTPPGAATGCGGFEKFPSKAHTSRVHSIDIHNIQVVETTRGFIVI